MTDQKFATDPGFDQLLRGYYGDHRRRALRMPPGAHRLPADAAALLASHYGKPPPPRYRAASAPAVTAMTLSLSRDDNEVLGAATHEEEYVLTSSQDTVTQSDDDEYVVARVPALAMSLLEPLTDVLAENRLDILRPLNPLPNLLDDVTPAAPAPVSATPAAPSPPATVQNADPIAPAPTAKSAPPASAAPQAPAATSAPDPATASPLAAASSISASHGSHGADSHAKPPEDDFMADMEAILSGKKLFDPATKKTVSKEQFNTPAENQPVLHGTDSKHPQAIFDKIAQSMQFANSYDLGTVELENRFADFDRNIDQQRQGATAKKPAQATPAIIEASPPSAAPAVPATGVAATTLPPIGTAEFIRDMDLLRQSTPNAATMPSTPMPMAPALTQPAQALDTGHAAALNGAFVATALQTLFANAAEIDRYFAALGATGFIGWFNANLANRGAWAGKNIGAASQANFTAIWNRIAQLFGTTQINLLQFLSLMSIFINEVGSALGPISERVGTHDHPGLAYAFDSIASIPKVSYNDGGSNQTAYECFRNADFIAAHGSKPLGAQWAHTEDTRWSGHVYPAGVPTDVNPAVTGFIMEADFYKFRGRGLIQTTWRDNYERLITWIQGYSGTQPEILARQHSWAGLTPARAAHASSNADWDALFMHTDLEVACIAVAQHSANSGHYLNLSGDVGVLNGHDAGSIWKMGKRVSGGSSYANLFRNRVIALCNQLGNADAN